MPDRPLPGRSLVTRRAVVDVVRSAVVTSYGVVGVDAGLLERLLGRLGVGEPGIRVRLDRGIEIDLHLTVGYGLPIAEVARQVDSAVRYAIQRALGREVRRLTVHVAGLRYQPASLPPVGGSHREVPAASTSATEIPPGADAAPHPEGSHRRAVRRAADARGDGRDGRGSDRPRRKRARAGRTDDA